MNEEQQETLTLRLTVDIGEILKHMDLFIEKLTEINTRVQDAYHYQKVMGQPYNAAHIVEGNLVVQEVGLIPERAESLVR